MKNARIIFALIFGILILSLSVLSFADNSAEVITGVAFDDGTITLTYAVPDASFGQGTVLKVFDNDADNSEETGYEVTESTALTIGGKSYKQFSTKPIRIQHLNKTVFASISDGANTTGIMSYSVFDHIVEHFADSTADQKELFIALLDIGGAMQRQLLGTTLLSNTDFNDIGYYADQYSVLRIATYVDGELYGTKDEHYFPGDSTQIVADKALSGAVFTGFADKDGNAVSEYGELTAESYNK